jgi:tetratricopeptide (TPR) repeat protein
VDRWSYDRGLLRADAMADRGDMEGARAAYEALARQPQRDDQLRYVRYRLAYLLELEARWDEALRAYDGIWRTPADTYDDRSAQALYRMGMVFDRGLGQRDEALEAWDRLVRAFPNSNFAEDGLFRIRSHWLEARRPEVLLAWLSDRFEELRRSEIADNLLYTWARVMDDTMGRCDEAIPAYATLIGGFPRGTLVDDAIWYTAQCHGRRGRLDEEFQLLLDFIDGREISFVMADYDSPWYGAALRRMAEIRETQGRLAEAIEVWERFLRTFPLSLRADDTGYHLMELYAALGQPEAMRRWLDWLREEHPESRWLVRGEALCARTGGCA